MKTIDTYITERLKLNNDSKIAKLEKIGCKEFIKLINGNTDFGKFETPKWDKANRKFSIYNGHCYEIQKAMRGQHKQYIFVINYYIDDSAFVIKIFEEDNNKLSIIMSKIYATSFSRIRKVSSLNRDRGDGRSFYLNKLIVDEFIDMMNDIKNNCKYDADMLNKFNECDDQWQDKKYYID